MNISTSVMFWRKSVNNFRISCQRLFLMDLSCKETLITNMNFPYHMIHAICTISYYDFTHMIVNIFSVSHAAWPHMISDVKIGRNWETFLRVFSCLDWYPIVTRFILTQNSCYLSFKSSRSRLYSLYTTLLLMNSCMFMLSHIFSTSTNRLSTSYTLNRSNHANQAKIRMVQRFKAVIGQII